MTAHPHVTADERELDTPATRSIKAGDNRKFLGHPLGLGTLFGVEMMERFSFYGMKALLAYYIYFAIKEGGLGFDKPTAAVIVATYGAAVYLLSVVGGYAADRLMGARKSTLYGGIIITLGHIAMALPIGAWGAWIGLCLIALGTGFLKPNISTMVGSLYTKDDPRRDGGFEIFYMSINIGGFLSPFVCGALWHAFNSFHAGFAAAAVGMIIAVAVFVIATRSLHGAGDEIPNPLTDRDKKMLPVIVIGIIVIVAGLFFIARAIRGEGELPAVINDVVFLVALIASVYYFVSMYRDKKTSALDKKHILAYLPLYVGACMFWMVFEQASGYMAVFAESNTNLKMGGLTINPEWYQSVNPIAIVVLAPLFGMLFTRLAGRFPSTPMKFAIAVFLVGLSAFAMQALFSAYPGNGGAMAPAIMLALVFVLQTVAELFLSPVGLSATTSLAPKHFASQVMGLWFLTSSVGQGFAGQIIKATEKSSPAQSYMINGILTVGISLVLFALVPWTRKQMQDVEDMRRDAADRHRRGEVTYVEDAGHPATMDGAAAQPFTDDDKLRDGTVRDTTARTDVRDDKDVH